MAGLMFCAKSYSNNALTNNAKLQRDLSSGLVVSGDSPLYTVEVNKLTASVFPLFMNGELVFRVSPAQLTAKWRSDRFCPTQEWWLTILAYRRCHEYEHGPGLNKGCLDGHRTMLE